MISLVMAVKDNLEWTRKGIESLLRCEGESFELIVVDNGSAQETQDYLREIPAVVIRNEDNLGCAQAWNQGVRRAQGYYVCIVNNDIEVPVDWLVRLKAFYCNHSYALISPSMREGDLNYELDAFNQQFRRVFQGHIFEDEFRGTALFCEKSLFESVGMFDERFLMGKYEDEDFFMRLKRSGLKTAVTTDVCIHHYGSKTIAALHKSSSFNFEKINRRRFWQKWWPYYPWRKWHKLKIQRRRRRVFLKTGLVY